MRYIILFLLLSTQCFGQDQVDANAILKELDRNIASKSKILTSEMVVYGKRSTRRIRSKSVSEGSEKTFTEYISPAKERGVKMLKLKDRLWLYSPSTDRTIQLSGHMLRQSVMGSDLSYEDMMEDRKLHEIYDAALIGEEEIDKNQVFVLELQAKLDDVAYSKRKIWVDKHKYTPVKEELYAKSGDLLKLITYKRSEQIGGRWYPMEINYKDVLKQGKGTDFIIISIEFDKKIPAYWFSKGILKK